MSVSRRNFLKTLSVGAAVGMTAATPAGAMEKLWQGEPARPPRRMLNAPILLNSNENAYGPPPKVMDAMRDSMYLANRYPDRDYGRLTEAIIAAHKVNSDQVLLGCGSTEILRIAGDAFTTGETRLVVASPTFEAIARYAESGGTPVIHVPLDRDYAHDLDAMLRAGGSQAGLFYICNPNNPTASITPRKRIEAFLGRIPSNARVLIDEAYHHFAGGPQGDYVSFLDRPFGDDRVIVARTFSKIFGLAGMRLGYAVSTPANIARMKPYQLYDNVNIMAARGGIAGLDDDAGTQNSLQRNAADRREFIAQARARNLSVIPSYANFVMMETGVPIETLISYFESKLIHIGRPFPPMNTFARISLGLPAEMQTFWKAWDERPGKRA